MIDGRGIVVGVILGVLAWCLLMGLLYAFTRLVSFIATVYEQDATPRLIVLDSMNYRLSDKR